MQKVRRNRGLRLIAGVVRVTDRMMESIGRLASWCCLLLVLVVGFDVGLRYLGNRSFVASRDLEWWLFSLIFLLGGGFTLSHDQHVRVDIFYQRLGSRGRALINLAGVLLLLLPGCWLVIATSLPFVAQSWQLREGSPDPGGLPAWYLIKAAIPLGFGLLLVQGISFFCRNLLLLCGRRPEEG
ncbi:MAG: TRAP transporter small permease subunit [Thermodesulfobacteriota bacterium]